MLAGMDAIGGFVGTTSTSGGTGGSFAVSVSPTDVSKSGASRGSPRTLTTPPVTVTAEGGAGGYTYSWSRTSGSASVSATASTSATCAFTGTLNVGDGFVAGFTCTVTDAAGAFLLTDEVTATLSLEDVEIGGTL